jgi:DNA-binding NarL/FixJ family response regulator
MTVEAKSAIKVLLVEDEDFTRTLIRDSLMKIGMHVIDVGTVQDALAVMDDFDPHVVVSDLDLGPGPDGADLLFKVEQTRPWTGMVVLTAHASPELALHGASRIPENATYLVKSQISSSEYLKSAIEESIVHPGATGNIKKNSEDQYVISATQGEILRMIADGLSNAAIARERNVTLRAAEALIQRTFAALGVKGDPDVNSRVVAVRLWQQGKVVVK